MHRMQSLPPFAPKALAWIKSIKRNPNARRGRKVAPKSQASDMKIENAQTEY
jgi:hypothetical protein